MSDDLSLTYKKKILLYLDGYVNCDDELLPKEITQEGIAEGVYMSRTHVSRILQGLKKGGYLDERTAHVRGRTRKLKTYTLTDKGIAAAKDVLDEIRDLKVDVIKDGERYTVPLADIENELCLMDAIDMIESGDGVLDLDSMVPEEPVVMLDEAPDVSRIYGRNDLLSKIDDWMDRDIPTAVLYGTRGFGASSTAKRFLDSVEDRHLLWVSIHDNTKEKIEDTLREFAVAMGREPKDDIFECLKREMALIVFDGYHDVKDDIVDMFTEFVEHLDTDVNLKVIITVREGTPVYERFYHKKHVENGVVEEFKVTPLNSDDAEKLLGVELDAESLKRIMQMTKGSPLLLTMLKEDDVEGMKSVSPLTKGQISLLMFLKTQERDS